VDETVTAADSDWAVAGRGGADAALFFGVGLFWSGAALSTVLTVVDTLALAVVEASAVTTGLTTTAGAGIDMDTAGVVRVGALRKRSGSGALAALGAFGVLEPLPADLDRCAETAVAVARAAVAQALARAATPASARSAVHSAGGAGVGVLVAADLTVTSTVSDVTGETASDTSPWISAASVDTDSIMVADSDADERGLISAAAASSISLAMAEVDADTETSNGMSSLPA
jgi:hypothetical protein